MKNSILVVSFSVLGVLSNSACAAERTATPDPALVAHYQADKDALNAKTAECKKKNDLVAILTDVACMSADAARKKQRIENLSSKCNLSDTFVFTPPNMNGKELEAYLLKNAPSDAALRDCGQTKEQWLQSYLKNASKK